MDLRGASPLIPRLPKPSQLAHSAPQRPLELRPCVCPHPSSSSSGHRRSIHRHPRASQSSNACLSWESPSLIPSLTPAGSALSRKLRRVAGRRPSPWEPHRLGSSCCCAFQAPDAPDYWDSVDPQAERRIRGGGGAAPEEREAADAQQDERWGADISSEDRWGLESEAESRGQGDARSALEDEEALVVEPKVGESRDKEAENGHGVGSGPGGPGDASASAARASDTEGVSLEASQAASQRVRALDAALEGFSRPPGQSRAECSTGLKPQTLNVQP